MHNEKKIAKKNDEEISDMQQRGKEKTNKIREKRRKRWKNRNKKNRMQQGVVVPQG